MKIIENNLLKGMLFISLVLFPSILKAQELDWYWSENGKYGCTDEFNQVIIPPKFDFIREFTEGLAAVCYNDKWGYIDPTGKFMIAPRFEKADQFSEGLAAVVINGKCGYINRSGKIVIQPQFTPIEPESLQFPISGLFSHGVACVKVNDKYGFINKAGAIIIPAQFDTADIFYFGYYNRVSINGKYGYIDTTGVFIIPPKFDDAPRSFPYNSPAAVEINNLWGYINSEGDFIIQPRFDHATYFSDSLAAVEINGFSGYINTKGEFVTHVNFEHTSPFKEGLGLVKLNGKWGFLNTNGELAIENKYTGASSFSEGFASVEINGKWGFINHNGDLVIEPKFDSRGYFNDGLAYMYLNGNLVFVNKNGYYNTCKGYALINYSYATYMHEMIPSWENYSILGSKEKTQEYIKKCIEEEINKWQQKGEFETTAKWKERVNEQSRANKIKEVTNRLHNECTTALTNIRKEYETTYRELSNRYCQLKATAFAKQDFTLMPYDADNETFLISSAQNGDILLPVPAYAAPQFKHDWEKIKSTATAVFVPTGNDIALKEVTFGKYTYDSKTQASYTTTSIDYNFAPIEISDLALSSLDFNFNQIDFASTSVTSTTTLNNSRNTQTTTKLVVGNASDVDLNIPQTGTSANKTFAIVVANEKYQNVQRVENANNDGKVMAQYLANALGVPKNQIFLYYDASYGNIISSLDKIKNISTAYQGSDFNVIFYYAGHGIPDEQSHEAYLLPIDGIPGNNDINIPLSKLYTTLGSLGASFVCVILDACFSGAQRGNGMLSQARSVAIKPKSTELQGNMVVLSAAQGDETAYPYSEKSHGLFTYYLLKKLQEGHTEIQIGEIADFVIDNVKKTSVLNNNGKIQTPTIRVSSAIRDTWRTQRLVK